MKRHEAIRAVLARLAPDEACVLANGRIVREALRVGDRPGNFYMLSSMGHASTIALGVALARPSRRVTVLDGDGNLLMNLGALAQIGAAAPRMLRHLVLDNGVYGTTGGQPTLSPGVDFEAVARAAGYRWTARAADLAELEGAFTRASGQDGPTLIRAMVDPDDLPGVPVFDMPPEAIRRRFAEFLAVEGEGR